jgi:hypothetical protein
MTNSEATSSIALDAAPAYPADGALVTVVDGDHVRRGWISVECSDSAPVGPIVWSVLMPVESGGVWTGLVALDGLTIEQQEAPEWWSMQTVDLMQALVRAKRASVSLVEDAHRWADENSLCGVFDQFMRKHELPPRRREYKAPATVTLTLNLSVPLVARYGEDAQDLIGPEVIEQAVRQHFGGLRRHGLAVTDFAVGELMESDL